MTIALVKLAIFGTIALKIGAILTYSLRYIMAESKEEIKAGLKRLR